MKSLYILLLFIGSIIHASNPEDGKRLVLPALFSDHMVLQQKQNVAFWGKAPAGVKVTISASWGKSANAITDSMGNWSAKLPTPVAGGPYEITIKEEKESITLKDVLVGEVWLASGQSNMEMPIKGWPPTDLIVNSTQEISNANYPAIRFLKVPLKISETMVDSFQSEWIPASPQTAADFSATAYFFARKLHTELNIPIGIIQSAVSGTPAEACTNAEYLAKLGDFDKTIAKLGGSQNEAENWFKRFEAQQMPVSNEQWKTISFLDSEAAQSKFDDSQWANAKLPGRIDLLGSGEFDGAIWFRREFEVDDAAVVSVLKIASVDDMDAIYINGVYVGGYSGSGFHSTPREVSIPAAVLRKGKNTIAIRVIDTGGPGYVNGPILISTTKGTTIPLEGNWKSRMVAEIYNGSWHSYGLKADLDQRPDISQFNSNSPTVLFNGMINPLLPYTIKGAIWYQGETNVGRDAQYKKLFPLMIENWRNKWGYDFPFYFVEIAPFIYGGDQTAKSQQLRNAQRYSLKVPKTGMVTTADIGNETNIHPAQKQEVGNRLAMFALVNDYGKNGVASGPLFKSARVAGNELVVTFDGIGKGLKAGSSGLTGFEIAGKNKEFVKAAAKIVGTTVVVSNPKVSAPVYVRYAWSDEGNVGLVNSEGLPAATFTSEE